MKVIDGLQCTWDFKDRLVAVENDQMRATYTYDYTDLDPFIAALDAGADIAVGSRVLDPARVQALKDVAKDDRVKALVVAINSPGGTVVGSENLFHQLRAVAAKKPVVAVMGTLAASGGFCIFY
mgnify:CR=1 FL=1